MRGRAGAEGNGGEVGTGEFQVLVLVTKLLLQLPFLLCFFPPFPISFFSSPPCSRKNNLQEDKKHSEIKLIKSELFIS